MTIPRASAALRSSPARPRGVVLRTCVLACATAAIACDRDGAAPEGSAPSSEREPARAATEETRASSGDTRVDGAPRRPARIHFTDVTAESGIDLVTTSGARPSTQILEVKGGGLGLIDFDDDGDLDLIVPDGATLADTENGPGTRVYRNESISDDATRAGALRFTDVTRELGIDHRRWSFGVAVGDVNADGRDDFFLGCFGPDALFVARADGTFEEVGADAGVADPGWTSSAAFADLDADGDLDLYAARYLAFDPAAPPPPARFMGLDVLNGPRGLRALADRVYENDGSGRFSLVTTGALGSIPPRFGLNVAILDFDDDGVLDVLVANDSQGNFLWRGERDAPWAFEDVGLRSGIATNMEGGEQASMGIAIGDVDGDERPDVFTTNFSSDTNTLHLNRGRFFDDRTARFGLALSSRPMLGWGTAFLDLDHDGDEDLVGVNGHVYPQATRERMDSDYAQVPLLLAREGDSFVTIEDAGEWASTPRVDRTMVAADLDRDGDVDLVVAGLGEPIRVVRNDLDPTEPDWMTIALRDARPGVGDRHAIGARIAVGGEGIATRTRWVVGGGPFQSTWAPEVHVGLPERPASVEIAVRWPDGTRSVVPEVPVGRHVVLVRTGDGVRVEPR